jgi:hypothetical protein
MERPACGPRQGRRPASGEGGRIRIDGVNLRSLFGRGPSSPTTVVLVLVAISLLQGTISYTLTFGSLAGLGISLPILRSLSIALRLGSAGVVVVLWLLGKERALFAAMIAMTGILTVGLIAAVAGLLDILLKISPGTAITLAADVVMIAITNVLIFSVWYWIIDPPGIDGRKAPDREWDFLFPQRSGLSGYESWLPSYTDYLFIAFNTTLAFSPTDTLPLTKRAKWLMMLQATISVVSIVVIAASAINNL